MSLNRKSRSTSNLPVCMVVGGTGAAGRCLVEKLISLGALPVVISRDEYKQALLKRSHPEVITYVCDIRSKLRLREVISHVFDTYGRLDYVYNCAALKRVDVGELAVSEFVLTDYFGACNLIVILKEFFKGNKLFKFPGRAVLVSSDKASSPVTVYGATKLLAERYWARSGYACVRYGNIVNSRGSVLGLFQDLVKSRSRAPVTHIDASRFCMSVSQSIDLILSVSRVASRPGVYIPSSLKSFRIVELARLMWSEAGFDTHDFMDIVGLRGIEKIHETLVSSDELPLAYKVSNSDLVYLGTSPEPHWEKWTRVISSNTVERLTFAELKEISKLEVVR